MEAGREARVARWLTLMRVTLPAIAPDRSWPIRLDHCFMRVCLDTAVGAPWILHVGRPAVRTMSDEQLDAAIAVAEAIVADPDRLPALNDASLSGRRALRHAQAVRAA